MTKIGTLALIHELEALARESAKHELRDAGQCQAELKRAEEICEALAGADAPAGLLREKLGPLRSAAKKLFVGREPVHLTGMLHDLYSLRRIVERGFGDEGE